METLINRELDLRGLSEPVRVLRTRHALHDMQAGDVLMVTTTDRDTLLDFGTYCELSGNTLLLSMEEDDMYTFLLRKRSRGLS
jgi:tRNA 2-thiouridine synthesizing protein A